ncbi:Early nodulin-like protein 2 [Glycine soja]
MDGGDSTFQLSNSSLFYFISGNLDNCKNGQKLIVLVMAGASHWMPKTRFLATFRVDKVGIHHPNYFSIFLFPHTKTNLFLLTLLKSLCLTIDNGGHITQLIKHFVRVRKYATRYFFADEPWFQYLFENNLMPGDEVVFFFRFDEHTWEVLFMKEVIWDDTLSIVARQFDVGGKDGWVLKPTEDYDHWAQRNRFQVNDTLHFKYNKGSDSVVVVKKEDFDSCNINNPIQKMDGGDSTFQLSNSGLFYFISGNLDNCKNGQKLIVLVMAARQPIPRAALPPQKIPATSLTSPAPTPTDNSGSGRVGVSVGIVLMFTGFVGLV